jgi:hypothetical protein
MDTVFLATRFHLASTDAVNNMRNNTQNITYPKQNKTQSRACGLFHEVLYRLLVWYCSCFEMTFDANIVKSPLGLILKWTDRTIIEEAAALQMARPVRMPVSKGLSGGEHLMRPSIGFSRY